MTGCPRPFSGFEWMIAWRYLRARRQEGGISVMTWISLIGITLAVFALIATLAVRSGFRTDFVTTILGANAHITVYESDGFTSSGVRIVEISDYESLAKDLSEVPGVTRAAPLVKGQVMISADGRNAGVEVFGISEDHLRQMPAILNSDRARGRLDDFQNGISIGSGVAQELRLDIGDTVQLITPNGVRTAFGTSPRIKSYDVVHIFSAGRYDIDKTRIYMPFEEAQGYFNRTGFADEIEIMLENPERLSDITDAIRDVARPSAYLWTWKDASSGFLRALDIEDNVMFIILSILVLIASLNIVSGLIMLVKNKGRDIGILRTMGLSEGSVLRVFFICGASTGLIGTVFGVALGCLFAVYIDPIFSVVDALSGGGAWDPSVRGLYSLPAELRLTDVLSAAGLSLGLSFIVTYFPARRAAKMNPVEALRYE